MRPAPRLERKKAFRLPHAKAKASRQVERRPSFAARVFELLFQRKASSLDESRPKSWSGTPEKAAPEAALEPLVRHASTNVILPRGPGCSIRPAADLDETGEEEDKCDASWRQRQTNCVNCGGLFFISQSTLSCGSSRFCSLDCKTTFEYVNYLQEVLAEHVLSVSDGSSDSSLDDSEYDVEEVEADQLF
jgi:hypothetical protein